MARKTSDLAKEGIQSVGGFFHAFDIAFFMPGAIVLLATWLRYKDSLQSRFPDLPSLKGRDDAAGWLLGLVFVIVLVVATFVTGLFCHAIARIVCSLATLGGELLESQWHVHPYKSLLAFLFHDRQRDARQGSYRREGSQLSIYLWNLSSLGWSLAVALMVVSFLVGESWHPWVWRAGALVLCLLGSDFRFWSTKVCGP